MMPLMMESISAHVTCAIPLLHSRVQSQSFITDQIKSPDMNLLHVFFEHVNCQYVFFL